MAKTVKVMEINDGGLHLVCIKNNTTDCNPYRLYKVWWDKGWHRKQIAKYGDFRSIICDVRELVFA